MCCAAVQAMQTFVPNPRTKAFTLVEMLVVIAIIGILAAMLMPVLHQGQARAQRIWCESNLKQIGLAYHTFANDHSGKFPIEVSTNDDGSMEYVENGVSAGGMFYTVFRTFQTLSNELVKPEMVLCSTDTRNAAINFAALQNTNVSYFVGANGTFDKPETILAGDRNLANDMFQIPTVLQAGPGYKLHWTRELHQYQGNVVFADVHVEEWNNGRMAYLEGRMDDVESLLLPSAVQLGLPWAPRSPAQSLPAPMAAAPEAETAPASPADSDVGMSEQDEHITKVAQNMFEWFYLVLLLLMLLYLTYKIRKWMHEREAKERARQRSRWSIDADEPFD
jgi:prepilin-type N-terminal cleavage/methylation domain-containing protein